MSYTKTQNAANEAKRAAVKAEIEKLRKPYLDAAAKIHEERRRVKNEAGLTDEEKDALLASLRIANSIVDPHPLVWAFKKIEIEGLEDRKKAFEMEAKLERQIDRAARKKAVRAELTTNRIEYGQDHGTGARRGHRRGKGRSKVSG